jgi:hypothetical protein
MQLFPGMSWGLLAVCMNPIKLDKMIQRCYERALPFLGVNRKIKKEWRTLPEAYQGLGLPNFPLVSLSAKISFLMEAWAFSRKAHSDALAMAYENFIVEVGLYDTPFSWNYDNYGHLSTKDTWFQNLWQLTHTFNAELEFHKEDSIQETREGDRSLMSEFFRIGYRGKDLLALNVMRKFRNLLHVSDIVKCNGHTINEFIISDSSELSVHHTFPLEDPTTSDFRLWKTAKERICDGTTNIPYTLGQFVREPHLPVRWYTTPGAGDLYRIDKDGATCKYDIYRCRIGNMETRNGVRFDWIGPRTGQHQGTHYTSITMQSETCAVMHSMTPRPKEPVPHTSFMSTLLSYGNTGLGESLSVEDGGEWIRQSMEQGLLVIAHDGSYMPEESTEYCSAGVVMYCSIGKKWLKSTIVEQSNAASNYRGE